MDGVEPDDEAYPPAPVPRHERAWRHPSEVGEATWRSNEPPLAIGRGLLITTGAIGGLLALAVLWAMLPTGAGGGPQALSTESIRSSRAAVSTVRQSTSSTFAAGHGATTERRPSSSAAATSQPAPTSTPRADVTRPEDTTAAGTDATTIAATTTLRVTTSGAPSSLAPAPSSAAPTSVAPRATISVSAPASAAASTAIAVVVNGRPVVLTTTGAVRATDDTVTLAYDDGTTTSAKVTMTMNGLAVLAPDAAASSTTFKVAATPHDGDTVTLLAPTPTAVPLHVDADGNIGVASWGGADVNEGTPVVNAAGKVVALCSKSSTGPKLVAVDQRTLRNAVGNASTDTGGSTAKPSKPYLGVQLNLDPSGSLTIGAVDPNGPVAAAGIVAGDTVVAIDDDALASSEDLFDALGEHQPGDEVEVTVRHSDGSEVSVDVVLGTSPTSA